MASVGKSGLLQVTQKEVDMIRAGVQLGDDASIARDVDMVLEWYEKQQHLPRIQLDRGLVEHILVSRKGSVEQTKQKIDMMYTLRGLIPDMAAPRDILHPDIQRQFKGVVIGYLPKLNHDQTRIMVFKFTPDVDNFDLADVVKYLLMTTEYRLKYDYCAGDRYVVDYEHISMGHVAKLNPITIKHAELYLQKGYGMRIRGIHYVNAPSFMGTILNLVKSALSEKLGSRLMVHPTYDDLHTYVSRDSLPKDYGGNGGDMEDIAEKWHQELRKDSVRQYLMEQETLKADERLRLGHRATDDVLGIPGSFKKINVD